MRSQLLRRDRPVKRHAMRHTSHPHTPHPNDDRRQFGPKYVRTGTRRYNHRNLIPVQWNRRSLRTVSFIISSVPALPASSSTSDPAARRANSSAPCASAMS